MLIEELVDALGPKGNVVMISSSRGFSQTGIFDVRDTKADTGLLTESFRAMPGVRRSHVPMVSFLALGPDAEALTKPYQSYLDTDSPMQELLRRDGMIMLIGVDYDKCTLYHLSEERFQVEYNSYLTFKGTMIDDRGDSKDVEQRYYVRRDLSTKKSVRWLGEEMEREGLIKTAKLGDGLIRYFSARDFDRRCMDALEKDRMAFLVKQ